MKEQDEHLETPGELHEEGGPAGMAVRQRNGDLPVKMPPLSVHTHSLVHGTFLYPKLTVS